MDQPRIAFRIVDARVNPRDASTVMLLECELETSPLPFYIRMKGRGLDDLNAGHSPKSLFIEREHVPQFVAQLAQAFELPAPVLGQRNVDIEWTTTLIENFSGHDADGGSVYEEVRNWRADKWTLENPEVELNCDYSLVDRRGFFSSIDAPDAVLAALARSSQRPR